MGGVQIKTAEQIKAMRRAGLLTGRILKALGERIVPGVTTLELDALARELLASAGAASSFLHYGAGWGVPPYPAVACISVNDTIVHGIPSSDIVLAEGDIVSIDFGAHVDGWHGDAARTFAVGVIDTPSVELIEASRLAMWAGAAGMGEGSRVTDISSAIQKSIRSHRRRFGIIREYTGHGIGSEMHQEPDVPNHGRHHRGPRLQPGMCLAIEPMITLGGEGTRVLDDEWTVQTLDGSRAAHWENTFAIVEGGVWVLTEEDGGETELRARGVPFRPLGD